MELFQSVEMDATLSWHSSYFSYFFGSSLVFAIAQYGASHCATGELNHKKGNSMKFFSFFLVALLAWPAQGDNELQPLAISKANNAFGIELLKTIKREGSKNQLISPVSAFTALSMLHAGSAGETQKEIAKVLHTENLSIEQLNVANSELIRSLGRSKNLKTEIANSIWVNDQEAINQDYESALSLHYRAVVRSEDFKSPNIAEQINQWASSKTHGKISQLIDAKDIDARSKALLLNATYFKGAWAEPFKQDSKTTRFVNAEGNSINAEFMSNESYDHYTYIKNNSLEAIKIPYKDTYPFDGEEYEKPSNTNMLVILPSEATTLDATLNSLNEQGLSKLKAGMKSELVHLVWPKFQFEANYDMKGLLENLGMKTAFGRLAELPGILASNKDLRVDSAFQKTYINVNELGTEAAAVTGLEMVPKGIEIDPKKYDMVVNRPFIIAIEDDETDAILFLGIVNNPSTK